MLFYFFQEIENFLIFFEVVFVSMGNNFCEFFMIWDFGCCIQILIKMLCGFIKVIEGYCDVDFEVLVRVYDIFGRILCFNNDYSGVIELYQYVVKVREENIGD